MISYRFTAWKSPHLAITGIPTFSIPINLSGTFWFQFSYNNIISNFPFNLAVSKELSEGKYVID